MYTIGIDLGGTHIAVGVVDENNNIVKKISAPTLAQRGPTEITKDMAALSKRVCEEVGIDFFKDVQKIGIASPGTVNPSTGKIEYANNIKMIDYAVVKEFSEFAGVDEDKITIGNDANLAVYGEVVAGAAKGAETAVLLLATRMDCLAAKFSWEVNPIAAAKIYDEAKNGLKFFCYGCNIDNKSISITKKMKILY